MLTKLEQKSLDKLENNGLSSYDLESAEQVMDYIDGQIFKKELVKALKSRKKIWILSR